MSGDYGHEDVVGALYAVGISRGDVVLVHSALFPLGTFREGSPREIPSAVYRAFRDAVGEEGTVVVPSAFEDYARHGVPYDCERSPVDRSQGVFSQYVTLLPGAVRTYCPMCAVTAIGPLARHIAHGKTGSAFGTGSAWERLHEIDARLCFLGVKPSKAFTFTAYIQFRFGVPHFYNKLYSTPVFESGKPVDLPITAAVRYLNPSFRIMEDSDPFVAHLTELGLIRTAPVGRSTLFAMPSARRIFDEGTGKLQENLFYFCRERPQFIPGQIPTDGKTGVFQPDSVRFGATYAGPAAMGE